MEASGWRECVLGCFVQKDRSTDRGIGSLSVGTRLFFTIVSTILRYFESWPRQDVDGFHIRPTVRALAKKTLINTNYSCCFGRSMVGHMFLRVRLNMGFFACKKPYGQARSVFSTPK